MKNDPLNKSKNPHKFEKFPCYTCGYKWVKGAHGGHSCSKLLLQRINRLQSMLRGRLDLIKCGIAHNFPKNSPYENDLYTSVIELLDET